MLCLVWFRLSFSTAKWDCVCWVLLVGLVRMLAVSALRCHRDCDGVLRLRRRMCASENLSTPMGDCGRCVLWVGSPRILAVAAVRWYVACEDLLLLCLWFSAG